jgi:hypothetical protein
MAMMKLRWFVPFAVLLPLRLSAADPVVVSRVAIVIISPGQVTPLHLRPDFESVIRMPEEVNSVDLGSSKTFLAEHNPGEPNYVYVKPITKQAAQSNLFIVTKSGLHVTIQLVSDGAGSAESDEPVDFLIEYRLRRSLLTSPNSSPLQSATAAGPRSESGHTSDSHSTTSSIPRSPTSRFDEEYDQQVRVNAPNWTKWPGKQIETSVGDVREWNNQTAVSYSIFNPTDQPVEIVPPQIQITGHKMKKKKQGKGVISDQLEIREYRLSVTRLEAGGRADGVVVFDRPNFKESTEQLFLQIAQADQVDQPILVRLPFTPPIAMDKH